MVHTSWVVIAMIAVTAQSAFGCARYLESEESGQASQSPRLSVEDLAIADSFWRARHGLPPKDMETVETAYVNRLQDLLVEGGFTPEQVRRGEVLLAGLNWGDAHWVLPGTVTDHAKTYPTMDQIRTRINEEVSRLRLSAEESEVFSEMVFESLVVQHELSEFTPTLADLARLRVVRFYYDARGERGPPASIGLGFIRHWSGVAGERTFREDLEIYIEGYDRALRKIVNLPWFERKGISADSAAIWKTSLLSRDLSDPIVAEEAVNEFLRMFSEFETDKPFRSGPAPFTTLAKVRAEVRRRKEAVESARREEKRAAAELQAREAREKKRQEEHARALQKAKEKEELERARAQKHLSDWRAELGQLGGAELSRRLERVSEGLFEEQALTESERDQAADALWLLVPVSSLATAEGPQAAVATKLAELIKNGLTSKSDQGQKEHLAAAWRKAIDTARGEHERRRLELEDHRRALSARPFDPRKHYPFWREQRDKWFSGLAEADAFAKRIDALVEDKIVNQRLADHWLEGARDHGAHRGGGWHAEVLVAERLGVAVGLKVEGYEAAGHPGGPDFLVSQGRQWQAFVESKSNFVVDDADVFRANLLASFQDAALELEYGHSRIPHAERVLWVRIATEQGLSSELMQRLMTEVSAVLPQADAQVRTVVIDVETPQSRGLLVVYTSDGTQWTPYSGGETQSPFLKSVWDPKDILH